MREKLPQGLVGGLDRLLLADAGVACAEGVDGVELLFARDTVLATDVISVVCRDATVRDRLRGLHGAAYPQPSPAWPPWVRELARTAADADDRPIPDSARWRVAGDDTAGPAGEAREPQGQGACG